jgi:hypothetical protein
MSKRQSQRTLLVKFAYTHKLLPLYCIYGHLPPELEPYAKVVKPLSDIEISEWSCSFISPKYVKKLNNQKKSKQADLLPYSFPWAYPFSYASSLQTEVNLASSVAQALANLREEFLALEPHVTSKPITHRSVVHHDDIDPRLLVTKDLPKIAVRLLMGSIKPVDSPIAALGFVSPTHINEILKDYDFSFKSQKRKRPRRLKSQQDKNKALLKPDNSKKFDFIDKNDKTFIKR